MPLWLLILAAVRVGPDNLGTGELLYPTSHVPAFAAPGGDVFVLVSRPVKGVEAEGLVSCLRCSPVIRFCSREEWGGFRCQMHLPLDCMPGPYHLTFHFKNHSVRQRLALRIADPSRPIRLLLTADHQLHDPTWRKGRRLTPGPLDNVAIMRQELVEFALIDPDVAIHLGDLIFGPSPQKELREALKLWDSRLFAMSFLPGNHDGYALYEVKLPSWRDLVAVASSCPLPSRVGSIREGIVRTFAFLSCAVGDLKRRLFDRLSLDSLELWRETIGPMDRSFVLGRFCFILLNTYSGGPQRRHSFVLPLDTRGWFRLLPEGVPLVDNYGGELTDAQIGWLASEMEKCHREGRTILVFGHHDPRGNLRGTRYHRDEPFPTDPISLDHFEEWNYDPSTQSATDNSGTRVVELLAKYGGWYFSGHVHYDAVYSYAPGEEIIPGIRVRRRVTFVKITTGASMTRKGAWWGYALLLLMPDGTVRPVSTPEGRDIPAGGFGLEERRLWSVLPFRIPIRFRACLSVSPRGYRAGWGTLLRCPSPGHKKGLFEWAGFTPVVTKPYSDKAFVPFIPTDATSNEPPTFTILADGKVVDSTFLEGVRVLEATSLHDEDGVFGAQWEADNREGKIATQGTILHLPPGFSGTVSFHVRDGLCAWTRWKATVAPPREKTLTVPSCGCCQGCTFGLAEGSLLLLILIAGGVLVLRARLSGK